MYSLPPFLFATVIDNQDPDAARGIVLGSVRDTTNQLN